MLKFIRLRKPLNLIETLDFTKVPALEKLVLEDCIDLPGVHPSIGVHKNLKVVNLKGCKNLKSLPRKFEMESLEILILSGCSKVKKIPEFGEIMKHVRKLYLDSTAITKLPTSIEHLTGLTSLDLRDCKNLVCLPDAIFNFKLLKKVNISGCSKFDRLPENLGNAESVEELDVSGTAIRQVPSSIGLLKNLRGLSFKGCKGLSSTESNSWYEHLSFYSMPRNADPMDLLSSLLDLCSLSELDVRDCNLKAIPNDIGCLFSLRNLYLCGNKFVSLPESISQLSNLRRMYVTNCTNLLSLPKLPSSIEGIQADNCSSLEMLPDLLKPNNSLGPTWLTLQNCFKLTDNQGFIDMFVARIIKHLLLGLFRPRKMYQIVIPGSEIPEWFSHQSMGAEVNIKEPVHLCNEWMGIVACYVFYQSHNNVCLNFYLIANGYHIFPIAGIGSDSEVLSDHLMLVYMSPSFYDATDMKFLWKCDANGFSRIGIRIQVNNPGLEVKKCGFRMVYKKDIEDLNRITAQCRNNNITPYEGIDVLLHNFDNSAVAEKGNKIKRSRDDYDGAGPSGEGSSNDIPNPKRI